jgi:hypothetical protein
MQIRKLTFATIACAALLASFLGAPARADEICRHRDADLTQD